MHRFRFGIVTFALSVAAVLFLGWPAVNTQLRYNTTPEYDDTYSLGEEYPPRRDGRATRWVEVGKTYPLLSEHFAEGEEEKNLEFSLFYSRTERVTIDNEKREVTFLQNGPHAICSLLPVRRCKIFIAE